MTSESGDVLDQIIDTTDWAAYFDRPDEASALMSDPAAVDEFIFSILSEAEVELMREEAWAESPGAPTDGVWYSIIVPDPKSHRRVASIRGEFYIELLRNIHGMVCKGELTEDEKTRLQQLKMSSTQKIVDLISISILAEMGAPMLVAGPIGMAVAMLLGLIAKTSKTVFCEHINARLAVDDDQRRNREK